MRSIDNRENSNFWGHAEVGELTDKTGVLYFYIFCT